MKTVVNQTELPGFSPVDGAALLDGADDLASIPESKWAPLLADLLRVLEALYQRRGMDAAAAWDMASSSTIAIADFLGGRVAYIPRGDRLRNAIRDAGIWRAYDGKPATIERLADLHGLSTITIYSICKVQRALSLAHRQRALF